MMHKVKLASLLAPLIAVLGTICAPLMSYSPTLRLSSGNRPLPMPGSLANPSIPFDSKRVLQRKQP
jgi:hypothetical protein